MEKTIKLHLTRREDQVLQGLGSGLLYKEIAYTHKISIDTVKKHCKSIYRKMKFRNRTEAAMYLNGQPGTLMAN
jgi:DNA-binding NarL/FixJ family response regulator